MKRYFINHLWFVIALIYCANAKAQYVADLKRTADIHFDKGNYFSAAQYYEKYLDSRMGKQVQDNYKPYSINLKDKREQNNSAEYERVVYRLAESYRLYFDFINAEKWYGKALGFNRTAYPLTRLWYGISLRTNKKYAEAEAAYTQFLTEYALNDEYTARAKKELNNTRFIRQQLDAPVKQVSLMQLPQPVNGAGANYAPLWLGKDSMAFTSSRPDAAVKLTKKDDPYLNSIYLLTGNTVQKMPLPEQANMHQGVASFSADHQRIYFTRWELQHAKNYSQIYVSNREANGWSNPKKLNSINMEGYSSKQPFVTDQYIFFSSDRPGGAGKFDLWYATIDANGNAGDPVNFGLSINSTEDDEAPYYHTQTQTLVFASNGRTGMGGFDLYETRGDIHAMTEPKNLGYPVNSVKDDIYFYSTSPYSVMGNAFISSDRNSVCCLEIYQLSKTLLSLNGRVTDCDTKEPLGNVTISLLDTVQGKIIFTTTSNAGGAYAFDLEKTGPFRVIAEMNGFDKRSAPVHFRRRGNSDTAWIESICLEKPKPYPVNQPVIMKDIFYAFNQSTLRPESYPVLAKLAGVMKSYPNMEIELGAHTDSKGTDAYNIRLSNARAQSCVDYIISQGVSRNRIRAKGFGECCPVADNEINGKDNPDGRALNRRTEIKILHY